MNVSANLKSSFNKNEAIVFTNDSAKALDIPAKLSGYGSSVNGAELLLLALATCFCNDIYREAEKRNIKVSSVAVKFFGDFTREGEGGENFRYMPEVVADASPEAIRELVLHTDTIAEIHKTLRSGIKISLHV